MERPSIEQLLEQFGPELEAMAIMYGLDSGPDSTPVEEGAEFSVQVQPFKAHQLERLICTAEVAKLIVPLDISIGLGGPRIPVELSSDDADSDHPVIRPALPMLIVEQNELVSLRLRVLKPGRVTFTAIARMHPADHARRLLFGELDKDEPSLDRIREHWHGFVTLRRAFEFTRAEQRGQPMMTDDMLGICGPPQRLSLEAAEAVGRAREARRKVLFSIASDGVILPGNTVTLVHEQAEPFRVGRLRIPIETAAHFEINAIDVGGEALLAFSDAQATGLLGTVWEPDAITPDLRPVEGGRMEMMLTNVSEEPAAFSCEVLSQCEAGWGASPDPYASLRD